MTNIWTIKVRDRAGVITRYMVRGPVNDAEARVPVDHIILDMRVRAIESGVNDPGLQIVEVTPTGEDEVSAPGAWRPPTGEPIDLNRYAKTDEIELVF